MSVNSSTRREVIANLRNEFLGVSFKTILLLSATAMPVLLFPYQIPGIDSPRPRIESRYPDVPQRIQTFKEVALHPTKLLPKQEQLANPVSIIYQVPVLLFSVFLVFLLYLYLLSCCFSLLSLVFSGLALIYLEADCRLFSEDQK